MAQRDSDFHTRLMDALNASEPYLGHTLLPIPLMEERARTERVSAYVELDLVRFLEEYKTRMGARATSEAVRRLIILGAIAEGYQFNNAENI